jgi:hypothetical protein
MPWRAPANSRFVHESACLLATAAVNLRDVTLRLNEDDLGANPGLRVRDDSESIPRRAAKRPKACQFIDVITQSDCAKKICVAILSVVVLSERRHPPYSCVQLSKAGRKGHHHRICEFCFMFVNVVLQLSSTASVCSSPGYILGDHPTVRGVRSATIEARTLCADTK